MSSELTDITR